jgi:hypothetical protein
MILDAIFSLLRKVLEGIFWLVPDVARPDLSGPAGKLAPLFALYGWANHYVPVDAALIMLAILLASWTVMHAVTFAIWALSKLHILGGGSQ